MLGVRSSYRLPYRFRWVFCQLEVLRYCFPASIRQTLDRLPESLDDTYLQVLRQIPQVNQAHAHRMLQCLLVAVRPLRVEELAELLAFEFDAAQEGIPNYRGAWQLDDQTQAVLSTCSSLIAIVDDWYHGQIVQFSHFSVKEFLMSDRLGDFSRYHIHPISAHTILTQACLGVLLHLGDHPDKESVKGYPLARYAAQHWAEHARFEDVASRVKDGIETLFDSDKPHFAAWVNIYNIDNDYSRNVWDSEAIPKTKPNPLYYSVLCGFYSLVKKLATKHPQYINTFFGRYGCPLYAALRVDHVDIAELLLERGANACVWNTMRETILLKILSHPHRDRANKVRLLLKYGADVNAQDRALRSPLHLAVYKGELEVAQMLVEHKADVNSLNKDGKTPLHILSEHRTNNEDDVPNHARLLFQRGAAVKRYDHNYGAPLHLAAPQAWFKVARILLEHGADASAEDNNGMTALQLLLEPRSNKEEDVLNHARLLLEHGAEVNISDNNYGALFHLAVRRAWFKVARILLEHGADATVENIKRQTPLHTLSESRTNDEGNVLNHALLLLKLGVDVNRRNKDNETPLHLAIRRSWFRFARILLEHGADATAVDNKGKTPLHMLSESRTNDEGNVLNHALLLLKLGVEVNRRDKDNETPLNLATLWDHFKLADLLLDHGADVFVENNQGDTPLHILSKHWMYNEGDVLNHARLLLKRGAEVNRRNRDNNTPLLLAMVWGQFKLARVLLGHGADANVEDNNSMSPLHLLSESRCHDEGDALDIIWPLLEHGAAVNGRDRNNQTPLLLAMGRGWFKLARILLENGADANAEDNNGLTPWRIMLERQIYDTRIVVKVYPQRLFLEHGAGVNSQCEYIETSLLLAILGAGVYKFARNLLTLMQMLSRRTKQARP